MSKYDRKLTEVDVVTMRIGQYKRGLTKLLTKRKRMFFVKKCRFYWARAVPNVVPFGPIAQ